MYSVVKNRIKRYIVLVVCCAPSQCRLETFQCWLFYYVFGEAIPKDDGGREKAVLINIELFRVASRCSGITGRRIWCYIHEIMFDLIKHGGSYIIWSLLCCSVSKLSDEIISETLLWRVYIVIANKPHRSPFG